MMTKTAVISNEMMNKEMESHKKRIWKVFGILTVITLVEVYLGIVKPAIFHMHTIFNTSILNWIFVTLTIVKAYYITWFFMHIADERKSFRITIVFTLLYLIIYLVTLLLIEGGYIHDVLNSYINWNY